MAGRSISTTRNSIPPFTRSYPSFQPSSSSSPSAKRPTAFFQQSFHPSLVASLATDSTAASAGRHYKWNVLAAAVLATFVSAYTLSSAETVKLEAAPASSPATGGLTSVDLSKQIVVDPDTNMSFPLYLPAPASFKSASSCKQEPRFRLAGLGVRTVSFLRVKVYVAALYIDETKLEARLLSQQATNTSLEETMKSMLDEGSSVIIRIVPVRNTDFNHLRDGFIRALQGRLKKAIKQAQVQSNSPLESEFQRAIQEIKESFPRGSVPKGSPLDLVILPAGETAAKTQRTSLVFEYDGKVFGEVKTGAVAKGADEASAGVDAGFTVARELVLAYFADQNEISTPFKKSVQQGLFNQLPSATSA